MLRAELRILLRTAILVFVSLLYGTQAAGKLPELAYLIPNTHGTIGGWQVSFVEERNFMLNNYLDHLNRVREDPHYRFVLSEVPTLMAMMKFEPDRFLELQRQIKRDRVELVNAFFLEPTINLSGGEALIKMGVEGIRWQQKVMGIRPRFCWMIDVVGTHRQMPQIVSGLGLEAFVYSRNNPTTENLHWWESPDGSKTLAMCARTYAAFSRLFEAEAPLSEDEVENLAGELRERTSRNPENLAPFLLVGKADYSTAPANPEQPKQFLAAWENAYPGTRMLFALAGEYLDQVWAKLRGGLISLKEFSGDTAYSYNAFWSDIPRVKQSFRRLEHQLQSSEGLATIASLDGSVSYPTRSLYQAWLQMLLNMDRNTLWGSAAGMVFEDAKSWDVKDRFDAVETISRNAADQALEDLLGGGKAVGFFNPLNWERSDPVRVDQLNGSSLEGMDCEREASGSLICAPELPSFGTVSFLWSEDPALEAQEVDPSPHLENAFYRIEIDLQTGDLLSLRSKSTGRELLGGPSNVIRFERPVMKHSPADYMVSRDQRDSLATSREFPVEVVMTRGTLATTVRVSSPFFGESRLKKTVRIYHHQPRIDFLTETEGLPDGGLLSADFLAAGAIETARRGIPAGFSQWKPGKTDPPLPYFMNRDHQIYGFSNSILPAVRWSSYSLKDGSGFALLDRGLTGRELDGSTVSLHLINAWSNYRGLPNPWLSGEGSLSFEYALVGYEDWTESQIPRRAWEFNSPPVVRKKVRKTPAKSYLQTSDNLLLQVVRREGSEVELRLIEWSGSSGEGKVEVEWFHDWISQTNLMGEARRSVKGSGGRYQLSLRPQQIVTLRFGVRQSVPGVEPLLRWADLVPPGKKEALEFRIDRKGHPRPAGHDPSTGTPDVDDPEAQRTEH